MKSLRKSLAGTLIFLAFPFFHHNASAQYAPSAGKPGTTAIHRDSSAFIAWSVGCKVKRGPQDAADLSKGYASAGDSSMANGKADGAAVSLGDGGTATCTFQYPIINGIGPDFAIFENAFDDNFLEFAFVEVSSDGINFFRFRSHSLTDTTKQKNTFDSTETTKVNNLAGKYRASYGTPFDLQELAGQQGLNINAVTHVRIKDVVGSMNNDYASRDGYNNKVNDPWPTPFPQSGFDLDAVGVIHQSVLTSQVEEDRELSLSVSPNPLSCGDEVTVEPEDEIISLELCTVTGTVLETAKGNRMGSTGRLPGMYLLRVNTKRGVVPFKILLY